MTTINSESLYWFTSRDGAIELQLPGDCLICIAQPGDNERDVQDWLGLDPVRSQINSLDEDDMRDELREYGAWSDEELADHERNKVRLLWIAAHNTAEEVRSGEYVA